MNFSMMQIQWLRNQGIEIVEPLASGTVKCSTPSGDRYYTAGDLVQLAKPGFFDRLTAWMNQGVAS